MVTTQQIAPVPDHPAPEALDTLPERSLAPGDATAFLRFLLRDGTLAPTPTLLPLMACAPTIEQVVPLLIGKGLVSALALTRARARFHGMAFVDPLADPADLRLVERLGAPACLRAGLLPWRRIGAETIVLCDTPESGARHLAALRQAFGPVRFALCQRQALDGAISGMYGRDLRRTAEALTPRRDSCRSLPIGRRRSLAPLAALVALVTLGGPAAPLMLLTAVAMLAMFASTALRGVALLAALRQRRAPAPTARPIRLPVVSVMVPLLHEADIAARLVRRLDRLDYPRELTDILLVVEAGDGVTRRALSQARLPPWMRVVVVPDGRLQTKPLALNHALGFCRGSIIGVYDAEDAPDPQQLRRVVAQFGQRDGRVACLQAALDFYNPRTNAIARCFTLEYATWFRVLLPGLERLGLPIPLGGTSVFFRRSALESLGGWDAHNVTEDADLGMRLHRRGYRTEVLDSVTLEEANCHILPWIRQRSRWIKGYLMTWRVHMRDPRALWRDLGPRGFAGFQVLILGSVVHALLSPLLLSFWLVFAGLPHPVADTLPQGAFLALFGLFLLCEAVNLAAGYIGLRRSGQRVHPAWLLAMTLYHPMAALAAMKAVAEMVRKPFYWDKTHHGRHAAPPPR